MIFKLGMIIDKIWRKFRNPPTTNGSDHLCYHLQLADVWISCSFSISQTSITKLHCFRDPETANVSISIWSLNRTNKTLAKVFANSSPIEMKSSKVETVKNFCLNRLPYKFQFQVWCGNSSRNILIFWFWSAIFRIEN